jgi:hypothetical protein
MKHPKEEELIAYRDSEVSRKEIITEHLADCPECREELRQIDEVLSAFNVTPVPDPGADYGRKVWQQIAHRLPDKPERSWVMWFELRRWVAIGGTAALVLAAFVAGRWTKQRGPAVDSSVASANQVRERVLFMAVGEHLGRSEMILVELANTTPSKTSGRSIDISSERLRAENLLQDNRIYQQAALHQRDTALANVLDELERVLLDVAHSPQELTSQQLETIRQRIGENEILFKVRVVGKELQERSMKKSSMSQNDPRKDERNKA